MNKIQRNCNKNTFENTCWISRCLLNWHTEFRRCLLNRHNEFRRCLLNQHTKFGRCLLNWHTGFSRCLLNWHNEFVYWIDTLNLADVYWIEVMGKQPCDFLFWSTFEFLSFKRISFEFCWLSFILLTYQTTGLSGSTVSVKLFMSQCRQWKFQHYCDTWLLYMSF